MGVEALEARAESIACALGFDITALSNEAERLGTEETGVEGPALVVPDVEVFWTKRNAAAMVGEEIEVTTGELVFPPPFPDTLTVTRGEVKFKGEGREMGVVGDLRAIPVTVPLGRFCSPIRF